MPRQSISSTKPDDEWLKAQMDWLRAKLEISEKSGFTTDTKEQILNQSKSILNGRIQTK
jgi:antitoxin ParD1/3/4